MADTPISGLNAISGAAATAADEFAVVNDAETKKISLAELKTALTKDGLSVTGNLSATGIISGALVSSEVAAGAAIYAKRTGGDILRITPGAANTGASIDVVDISESVYAPAGIFGSVVNLHANAALIGSFSPTGLAVSGNLSASGTRINFANLPTSATGLTTGDLWNDGGTLKIAP